jgi:hypothetical protein
LVTIRKVMIARKIPAVTWLAMLDTGLLLPADEAEDEEADDDRCDDERECLHVSAFPS